MVRPVPVSPHLCRLPKNGNTSSASPFGTLSHKPLNPDGTSPLRSLTFRFLSIGKKRRMPWSGRDQTKGAQKVFDVDFSSFNSLKSSSMCLCLYVWSREPKFRGKDSRTSRDNYRPTPEGLRCSRFKTDYRRVMGYHFLLYDTVGTGPLPRGKRSQTRDHPLRRLKNDETH